MAKVSKQKESDFQSSVIAEIKQRFPGAIVFKNDAGYIQGIPDWTVLWENNWALLEMKRSRNASIRPNQPYYVERANAMSFARFVYPENREEVLNEMERSFKAGR